MELALAVLALLGHISLCVAAINRIHSVAMPSWTLATLNGLWYLFSACVPVAGFLAWRTTAITPGDDAFSSPAWLLLSGYTIACWIAALVAAAHLTWRQMMRQPTDRLRENHTTQVDLARELGRPPVGTIMASLAARLPANGVFDLCIHEKTVILPRLNSGLDGLSIVHLSDLHFTGRVTRPFFDQIVSRANDLDGDLVVITGDIIDKARCLPWIAATLGQLTSRFGTYFILGNHDRRLRDQPGLRRTLADAGLIDLGGRWTLIEFRGLPLVLAGNELPWYVPAANLGDCPVSGPSGRPLRIALAHSPDQLDWARAHDFDLMLAGHTHGGQFCLPWIGPTLCPSRLGARYASGTFYVHPTLLHVSRGISGTRLFRLNCPPELTRLILTRG